MNKIMVYCGYEFSPNNLAVVREFQSYEPIILTNTVENILLRL